MFAYFVPEQSSCLWSLQACFALVLRKDCHIDRMGERLCQIGGKDNRWTTESKAHEIKHVEGAFSKANGVHVS